MSERHLVFSHANGFPAGTYRQLMQAWRDAGWQVSAVDKFGHDPQYPVTSNWPKLREQLTAHVEAHAPGGAWLVGHSLGGLLSLMVACRHPALVRGLVMLDSPIIAGWRAHSLRVIKATGLVGRVSPAKVSHKRRHEWPDLGAAHAHFASKAVFARWAPGVLDDYLAVGTEAREGRHLLAFDRRVETRIYNTLPHDLDRLLRRHPLRCPLGFVAGTRSPEVRAGGLAVVRRLAGERLRWIDGTHLYPMEKPQETADLVLALLADMGASASASTGHAAPER